MVPTRGTCNNDQNNLGDLLLQNETENGTTNEQEADDQEQQQQQQQWTSKTSKIAGPINT